MQRSGVQRLLNALRRTPWWHYDSSPAEAVAAKAGANRFTEEVAANRVLFDDLMAKGHAHTEALRSFDARALVGAPVEGTEVLAPVEGPAERTVMYVHGGGFVVGSPLAYRGAVASFLAHVPGARTRAVVPRYGLAPETELPAAVDDVRATYEWLADGGAPVVVVADSAGCYLALRALDLASRPAAGLALWSPFLRHHPRLDGPRRAPDDPSTDFLTAHALDVVGAAAHPAAPCDVHDAAHARVVEPLAEGLPAARVAVFAGAAEILLDDARRFAAADGGAAAAALDVADEMFHDYMLFPKFVQEGEAALAATGAFAGRCFADAEDAPR